MDLDILLRGSVILATLLGLVFVLWGQFKSSSRSPEDLDDEVEEVKRLQKRKLRDRK